MKGVKQDLNTTAILKEYRKGTAIRVLAVLFNTSRARIVEVLSKAGIVPSSRKTPWRHNYDEIPEYGVWKGDKS